MKTLLKLALLLSCCGNDGSNVKVILCVEESNAGNAVTLTAYDIWTAGTYGTGGYVQYGYPTVIQ